MADWISVDDRLPDKDEWVLVHAAGAINCSLFTAKDKAFSDPCYSPCYNINLNEITHWMALPEPPNTKCITSEASKQDQQSSRLYQKCFRLDLQISSIDQVILEEINEGDLKLGDVFVVGGSFVNQLSTLPLVEISRTFFTVIQKDPFRYMVMNTTRLSQLIRDKEQNYVRVL
jgi:hypothetical protein